MTRVLQEEALHELQEQYSELNAQSKSYIWEVLHNGLSL